MPAASFKRHVDLKLIEMVKENPMLYNPGHPDYMNYDEKEVIWQRISDTLSKPIPACKARWSNIRDTMRKRIRLQRKTGNTGKYKYEKYASFMIPFFKELKEQNFEVECEDASDLTTVYVADETNIDFEDTKFNMAETSRDIDSSVKTSNEVFHELCSTDPIDVFLLTIGSTLRKFSPYFLNQAKSKIFQVVQEYELQQIVSKEGEPPGSSRI